jgi:hypothetical protein
MVNDPFCIQELSYASTGHVEEKQRAVTQGGLAADIQVLSTFQLYGVGPFSSVGSADEQR